MKLFNEIFSGAWSDALVWTLVHSIWQGAVAMILLITFLRIIPGRNSSARYIVATVTLTVFLLSSVITYLLLYNHEPAVTARLIPQPQPEKIGALTTGADTVVTVLSGFYSFVESNLFWITLIWMTGAFLFSLRMVSGFFYISAIKKNATPLGEEWHTMIQQLSDRIGLDKIVMLSESKGIQVPFVVGFLKPVILMPVGMMSGLSIQQLETILVHELMHIKRNDYIINVIQTVVESVFFFNPFVWVMSSAIRREREHCCDDEVVKYGDRLSYAYALTRLEELNLRQASPALSLAENKNQLLNRIKRIMEKSVQNYSVKERIVPVVLLIVGLICASWFSIAPANAIDNDELSFQVANDTPKLKKTSRAQSKKKITVTDREGNPVIVEAEKEPSSYDMSFGYNCSVPPMAPPAPVEPFEPLPGVPFPPMEPFEAPMIAGFNFMFDMDSIPTSMFRNNVEWEAFSEDFQLKFKEKFGDFYKKHGEEMDKMMKEMGEEFETSFNKEWLEEIQIEAQHSQERAQHHMEEARAAMERDDQFHDERQVMAEQRAKQLQEHQEMLRNHEQELIKHQKEMQLHEERMKKFEVELREELVKDGYLGKDEKISNMHWNSDGNIEINGKDIKQEHRLKYQDLHRKHFKQGGSFHYVD